MRRPARRTTDSGGIPAADWARAGTRLAVFVLVGVVTLAAVSIGAVFGARQIAHQDALQEAEETTRRMSDVVISPLLIAALAETR